MTNPHTSSQDLEILAIGDSILEWNEEESGSIPDVIAENLDANVLNESVSGAFFLTDKTSKFDIRNQFLPGDWDWLVMDGGANDLKDDCDCLECTSTMDAIISEDGLRGAMPDFINQVVAEDIKVIILGYYEMFPPAEYAFADCGPTFTTYNQRLNLLAQANDSVWFVDPTPVIDPSQPNLYDPDRIHPSIVGSQVLGELIAEQITAGETPEPLLGTSRGDRLLGNDSDNTIEGLGGDDTLEGLSGNDTLLGGFNHDSLQGGRGNDLLIGQAGDDTLLGGRGEDTLQGGDGNDTYLISSTDDLVRNEKPDSLVHGIDTIITPVDWNLSTQGKNIENLSLTGEQFVVAIGNTLDNLITGSEGKNRLSGGKGNDTLGGYQGNDILIGGLGNDVLLGGKGKDQFQFNNLQEGGDTIVDFNLDTDLIRIARSGFGDGIEDRLIVIDNLPDLDPDSRPGLVYAQNSGSLVYFDRELTLIATLENSALLESKHIQLI